MQPGQGRDRGRDDDATLRARARRRLLRVDAVVPLECGACRAGRWRSGAVAHWCCGASSLRRSSFRTSAATARRMRTTSASRCPTCSPHPSVRTTRTTRCGPSTATRAHRATSSGSPGGSTPWWWTGSGPPRAASRSPARPIPRRARWARCRPAPRSSTSRPVEPCPPGVTGELVNIVGAGRFEGYYNDPDAEAERMRGGMYHSGDLAYRDENGYAYFAGRLGDWMRVDGENLGVGTDRTGAAAPSRRGRGGGVRDPRPRCRRSGDGRVGAHRGRRIRRREVHAPSSPSSPISGPSSGRRSCASAPSCRGPRRSR